VDDDRDERLDHFVANYLSSALENWRREWDSTPGLDNKILARYPLENTLHRIVRVVPVHF